MSPQGPTDLALLQALRKRVLRHPGTWTSIALVALCAAGFVWIDWKLVLAVLVVLVICTGAIVWWLWRSLRAEVVAELMNARALARQREHAARLGQLRADLYALAQSDDNTGDRASEALEHYQRLRQHLERFAEVLGQKLNVGELTYVRYHRAVQTLEDAIVESLDEIRALLHAGRESEAETRIEDLLAANADALTGLAEMHRAVGTMRSLDAPPESLSEVTAELERLSEATEKFR